MHILQLANFYGSDTGGLRVCLDQLADHYLANGHRCSLLVPGERDEVVTVGERTVVRIRSPFVPGLGGYRGVVSMRRARRAIERLAPDVIELSDKTSLAMTAAGYRKATGTPIVMISHERVDAVFATSVSDRDVVRSGIWQYNQQLLKGCDAIVCASQFAADEFRPTTPAQRLRTFRVPLGVDLDTFRPLDTAPGDGGPLRLVAVVRQSSEKDPWLIPATVRALVERGVDVEATVYGGGPLRAEMERRSRDLPLRYAGHLGDRSELAAAIAAADIACAPGPNETFGLGALEILACGTPLVVPERGALKELVTPECGRIAPSTGVAFADAIVALMAGDRATLRGAARRRAEQFTWQHAGERFLELHRDLVEPNDAERSRNNYFDRVSA